MKSPCANPECVNTVEEWHYGHRRKKFCSNLCCHKFHEEKQRELRWQKKKEKLESLKGGNKENGQSIEHT